MSQSNLDEEQEYQQLITFLHGSGEYKGRWFGDGGESPFSWRRDLDRVLKAREERLVREARIDELKHVYDDGNAHWLIDPMRTDDIDAIPLRERLAELSTNTKGEE